VLTSEISAAYEKHVTRFCMSQYCHFYSYFHNGRKSVSVTVYLLMVKQEIYGYPYLSNLAYPTYTSIVLMRHEI